MFKPPPELLKKIDFNGSFAQMLLPTFDDTSPYAFVACMVIGAVKENFKIGFDARRLNTQLLCQTFVEAVINAAEHGNQRDTNKNVEAAFWLGNNGVLFAVRDQGDFFSKQSTKELIESRTRLESTRNWGAGPSGLGLDHIYEADIVFVATEENAFYTGLFLSSILL